MIPNWTLDAWVDYHCWNTSTPRKYIIRALQSSDYHVRNTRKKENDILTEKALKRFCDIVPQPENVIEKLAWWIYANDLDWKSFARKYIKSVTIDRWMYMRQRNFDLINDEMKKEIETITEGYVAVSDWWPTKEPLTWNNLSRERKKR